ncbi:hypothetical protein BKA56DRAFT_635379 [Ilyonectria sp. MPI-CAGE-AT-0026]|nr:hypothetical protein BKA56DRAFT_635379 [Ilyonectria sp. MPI-CAGE-AT-0026]
MQNPEIYRFSQTPFVPNSRLPVLIYRNVLPQPHQEETAKQFLENNQWLRGGTFGAFSRHHFHPNTHECYAVFQGSSTLLIGVGPTEDEKGGQKVFMEAGDVIILPAGVSHCTKDIHEDYKYLGVYPKGSQKWKNEWCKDGGRCSSLREEAESVPTPEWDPVHGLKGPLSELWA